MKKILLTALAALPAVVMAQTDGHFTLKGKLGTLNAPAKVYLRYGVNGKAHVDSAVLKNGEFAFAGDSVKAATMAGLYLNKAGTSLMTARDFQQIYLEPGTITVTNKVDSARTAVLGGTKTNIEQEAYKMLIKPVGDIYDQMTAKRKAASAAEKETEAYKKWMDVMDLKADDLMADASRKFIKKYPASVISLNQIRNLAYSADYAELAPLYASLSPELKASANGAALGKQLNGMKNVALGATVPDFAMADTAGNMVKLSSFKGKYVLVDLWASWCGPCRQENPNVVRTFNKYKDRNFTVLGVSLDRPGAKDKWIAAIKKDGLTWTHVSDLKFWENEVAQAWGVQAIPQNFLLDPNGKVVAKNLRGDALDAKLAQVLKAEKVKAE